MDSLHSPTPVHRSILVEADSKVSEAALAAHKAPLYNRLAAYPIFGTPMGLLRVIYGIFKAIVGIVVAPFQRSFSFSKDGFLHIGRGLVEFFSIVTFPLLFKKNKQDAWAAAIAEKEQQDQLARDIRQKQLEARLQFELLQHSTGGSNSTQRPQFQLPQSDSFVPLFSVNGRFENQSGANVAEEEDDELPDLEESVNSSVTITEVQPLPEPLVATVLFLNQQTGQYQPVRGQADDSIEWTDFVSGSDGSQDNQQLTIIDFTPPPNFVRQVSEYSDDFETESIPAVQEHDDEYGDEEFVDDNVSVASSIPEELEVEEEVQTATVVPQPTQKRVVTAEQVDRVTDLILADLLKSALVEGQILAQKQHDEPTTPTEFTVHNAHQDD